MAYLPHSFCHFYCSTAFFFGWNLNREQFKRFPSSLRLFCLLFHPFFSELAPIANRLVVVVVVIEFPLFNLLLYFLVICPLCDLEVSEKEKEKVRIVSVCLCVCVCECNVDIF